MLSNDVLVESGVTYQFNSETGEVDYTSDSKSGSFVPANPIKSDVDFQIEVAWFTYNEVLGEDED